MLLKILFLAVTSFGAPDRVELEYLSDVSPQEVSPLIVEDLLVDLERLSGGTPASQIDDLTYTDKNFSGFIYAMMLHFQRLSFSQKELPTLAKDFTLEQLSTCSIRVKGKRVVLFPAEMNSEPDSCQSLELTYFRENIETARYQKALDSTQAPRDYSLQEVFSLWKEGQRQLHTDGHLVLPRKLLQNDYNPKDLARAMGAPKYLTLFSEGTEGVEDFFSSQQGLSKEKFPRLYQILVRSQNSRFYYFIGGGENWSYHILLVVDEHQQVYSFNLEDLP